MDPFIPGQRLPWLARSGIYGLHRPVLQIVETRRAGQGALVCAWGKLDSAAKPAITGYRQDKEVLLRKSALLLLALFGGLIGNALAAPDGARLFSRHCASCHGERGEGGIGVPLSLPSFQAGVTDEYLRRTIRHGRPGRVMPAFTRLSDAEVDALVRQLRSWGPNAGQPRFAPVGKGNVQRGKGLYAAHCASCHGAQGEGGKGTGVTFSRPRNLPVMAPALNNPGFLASASDGQIRSTIVHGRAGTPMPAFASKLSAQAADDLVAYIRAFATPDRSTQTAGAATQAPNLIQDSPYDLETTVANLKRAVESNNFTFIREQKLDYGLVPSARESIRQHVIYFCNFGMLNSALAMDPRVGVFLPCRITVVEQDGKVRLMATNPKRLSPIFNNAELDGFCNRMTREYRGVMEEATL